MSSSAPGQRTEHGAGPRIFTVQPERPLYGLRLRLTAWYVGTFAITLGALGVALFVLITRQIGASLDQSLDAAVGIGIRAISTGASEGPDRPELQSAVRALRGIRIPERALYLFDGSGRLLFPDTASRWVRSAAAKALREGRATLEADIGGEHTLRARARRVVTTGGVSTVIVGTADIEELEDAYAHVIGILVATLTAALVVLGFGGYRLALKSSRPVEESFARMRRFMADAAHELRTPVTVLRARLDIALQQPRDPADNVATLREASTEAERIATVVDDLFTLARAETGQQRPERRRVSLDDVAFEAVERGRVLAEQRRVCLGVGALDEAAVIGDPALIERLAMILLDNAIKYTPTGGTVTIAVEHTGRDCCDLVVSDTGVGIDAAELPRVFDRFYRAERTRTSADGAGLGLAIARWIADVHHASIAIRSQTGVGTSVRVTFTGSPGEAPGSPRCG